MVVRKLQGEFSKGVFNIDFCLEAHLDGLEDVRAFLMHPGQARKPARF